MRFIVMAKATPESEAAIPPKPEAIAAMQEFNEKLVKAGVLLAAEGLAATSKGARVKFSGDKRIVIDGPFDKRGLDPAFVAERERLITRGWKRLKEVAGLGLPIIEYPLPEVIERIKSRSIGPT